MRIEADIQSLTFSDDERRSIGIVPHDRHAFLMAPGMNGVANDALTECLNDASVIQARIIAEAKAYQDQRGNESEWSVGSLARIFIIFPPHPIRLSPTKTFVIPEMASLVFPPGSEIHIDPIDSAYCAPTLFDFPGLIFVDGKTIADSMRRDIIHPIIKVPELPLKVFNFRVPITNLTIEKPVIYGAAEAIRLRGWSTDTRIHGAHIENCGYGIVGEGGHNCHVYDNSFLTCGTGMHLVNCQSLHVRGNIWSQENSVAKPGRAMAIFAQGKNIVVDGNSIRDHHQNFAGNVYGGSFSGNAISYSRETVHGLDAGWMARLKSYDNAIGGTDWETHANITAKCVVDCNRVLVDDDSVTLPDPAVIFGQRVQLSQVMNRGPKGEWLKSKQVKS